MKNLPTVFQKNALWTAIAALSITVIGALFVGLIYLGTQVIAFLQPILIPFAVAGVLAYLLDPAVVWLEKRQISRQRAVLLVFAIFTLTISALGWWLGTKVVHQAANLDERVLLYSTKSREAAVNVVTWLKEHTGVDLTAADPSTTQETDTFDIKAFLSGDWVRQALPAVMRSTWSFVKSSVGGFLGAFGFLLSFIIVPLYLYYFLIESAGIKKTWSNYLPLRASAFKDEVVDCLTEINGYLVAFFRGQLFVSVINGIATGIGLAIVGLDFGVLIGLSLCVLGIIPFVGIALCWIPAVIIASVQGGSALVPGEPWWFLPLVVSAIFAIVQQIDALFVTPRVVGQSVGLHPMTVIVSLFLWSLLLGGLLGAILAIPLTAAVKVLFQRYIWRARLAPLPRKTAGTVCNKIFISSQSDQLSIYFKSKATQSSKLVIPLRPLICQRQVKPGFTLRRRRWACFSIRLIS